MTILSTIITLTLSLQSPQESFVAACAADAEAAGRPNGVEICTCIAEATGGDAAVLGELESSTAEKDLEKRMSGLSEKAAAAVASCRPS